MQPKRKGIAEDLAGMKQKRDDRKNENKYTKADNYEVLIRKKKQGLNMDSEDVC